MGRRPPFRASSRREPLAAEKLVPAKNIRLAYRRRECNNSQVDANFYRGFIAVRNSATKLDQVLRLVQERGVLRPRDLAEHGIPGDYLDRLRRRGVVQRVARGLYAWPDADVSEHHSAVEAAKLVPNGVLCLLSALQFHGLTTQVAHEVWLALPNKAWAPKVEYPPLRIFRYSGPALTEMVEVHMVESVPVKVYSPAKTVADCFKFRNKVGLDVALEALRDCWRRRRATMGELTAAAKVCRMENVMRPYLESLV
jgi:predicted transcriptional regulator of viral defense system